MPTVTQGIIDFALAPPIGSMNVHLDGNGPYGSGNHILTTWNDGGTTKSVSDTFGVVVQFNGAVPLHLGREFGFTDGISTDLAEFDFRLLQLVAMHQFAPLAGGPWIASQVLDIHSLPFLVRWNEALPGKVGLYVLPGISVDLFYLLVF